MEFKSKTSPTRADVLTYFDICNQEVLKKACLVDKETSAINARESHVENDSFDFAITSTPNIKKTALARKSMGSVTQENLMNQKYNENIDPKHLSVSKSLAFIENQRKNDTVAKHKAKVMARENQMLQESTSYQQQLQAISQAKAQKSREEESRILKEEESIAAERKQRQQIQQQRHAQRVSTRDEQIKAAELQKREAEAERKKKTAERMKLFDEGRLYIKKFNEIFTNIHQESKSCQALSPYVNVVSQLSEDMPFMIKRISSEDVNQKDVDTVKDICAQVNSVYTNVLEEIAKINKIQSEEKEAIRQQELVAQSNISHSHDVGVISSEAVKESSNDCADKESLQWYQELKVFKENNEKLFEQLLKDDNYKKYRFDCQKAVNIPVNAISPVNASHLRDKLNKLSLLLSGQSVAIGDGVQVSAARHPAGIPFCKDLLAKKFVRQGASTVSSKPEAAFAIAAVIVALWQEYPDWGQLLLAHFHQECPYLVPVFWPQLEGQSNKDYYQSLGYTYNEDGEVEKQDKFLKRMSGIMRLYTAILISRVPRERQSTPHPHDLGQGWRWLARILNLEPRPDICASLLYDFLEVVGSSMLEQYGRQYCKLLHVIRKEYFPHLQKIAVSSSGPVVRLETFLQTISKQNGIKPPQGMLPTNFW